MRLLPGQVVHVRDHTPRGWVGRVRSQTGTVVTIVTTEGVWRLVDVTRQEVRTV